MADLHRQLLNRTRPLVGAPGRLGAKAAIAQRALRAVVELHAPVALPILREGLTPWLECSHCVDGLESDGETLAHADWPCSTIQAIARELGIETP